MRERKKIKIMLDGHCLFGEFIEFLDVVHIIAADPYTETAAIEYMTFHTKG